MRARGRAWIRRASIVVEGEGRLGGPLGGRGGLLGGGLVRRGLLGRFPDRGAARRPAAPARRVLSSAAIRPPLAPCVPEQPQTLMQTERAARQNPSPWPLRGRITITASTFRTASAPDPRAVTPESKTAARAGKPGSHRDRARSTPSRRRPGARWSALGSRPPVGSSCRSGDPSSGGSLASERPIDGPQSDERHPRTRLARYRERVRFGDAFGRFAFVPERPARTITLLVRLTASRST